MSDQELLRKPVGKPFGEVIVGRVHATWMTTAQAWGHIRDILPVSVLVLFPSSFHLLREQNTVSLGGPMI